MRQSRDSNSGMSGRESGMSGRESGRLSNSSQRSLGLDYSLDGSLDDSELKRFVYLQIIPKLIFRQ